jgi:NAD(P)-dependent dehydrogenase (short-subunit alcohol dehydrogenase family)
VRAPSHVRPLSLTRSRHDVDTHLAAPRLTKVPGVRGHGPCRPVAWRATLRKSGHDAVYLHHDVSLEEDWQAAVACALETYGALDILVNNAGIGDLGTIDDTTTADYLHTIAVTQHSVFLGMKMAADALKASPHASVVNNSSIFGASGGFGTSPAYQAAKGAVRLLTKNAALHWADHGIRGQLGAPGLHRHSDPRPSPRHGLRAGDDRVHPGGPVGSTRGGRRGDGVPGQ